MGFISLTHLQTALNKIKTMLNNKAELTDIPDKLPADGGNADTVDGKHAVDIMNMGNFAINRTIIEENTDLDTMRVGGKYVVNSKTVAESCHSSPFTESGFYFDVVRHSSGNVLQIATLWTGKTKIRGSAGETAWNAWVNIADGGNADTVNGKSVFYNTYSNPTQFGLTLDSSANEIWTKLPSQSMFVIERDLLTNADWNFPEDTTLYTLVVIKHTSVRPAGIYLYPKTAGEIYYALVDDNGDFVSTWRKIADGGNAATVNGHTVHANVPSGAVFTDTKVTNTLAKTTKAYVTGTTSSSTNTGTQVFDTGVYLDTTAGQIVATTFKGALSGNASTATALTSSAGNSGKPIYFSNGKPVVCSTIITVRTGALPKTTSSSSSIKLSYLSNYSKATIFVYMNQSFGSADEVRANRIIDTITITGISSSMTAASYILSPGASTGCDVSISSAGVITLTVPIGKSYKQNYVVFYYN